MTKIFTMEQIKEKVEKAKKAGTKPTVPEIVRIYPDEKEDAYFRRVMEFSGVKPLKRKGN